MNIPFAEFVLGEISVHGFKFRPPIHGHGPVYIRHSMNYSLSSGMIAANRGKDDYSWFVGLFSVKLHRGPEYFKIKLTRDQAKAFRDWDKARKADDRMLAREKILTRKFAEIDAQTWP